jgi:hypothetical protein
LLEGVRDGGVITLLGTELKELEAKDKFLPAAVERNSPRFWAMV